jgi:beta-mannosidase
MSEYGFQGMPNLETFSKFTNSENLNLNSEAVKAHQKHNTGYQTIQTYMERDYKVPTKFEDYIYVSQLLQAEGMKTAIEAHRRAKPYCMGTLFWQLNDCWPVTSWSSVDYFGNWKAFHYQAKRSFENILISVNEEENQYKVYIIHDELTSEKGKLEVRLIDFSGKNLWNTNSEINVEANSSMSYFEIDKKEFEKFNLKEAVLNLKFNEAVSNFYFVKPKDLQLKTPTISIKVLNETTIQISTNKLAKNVFLSQEETSFNENYFDLLPNEKRIITISKPAINVKVMSLFDTMK